MPCHSTPWRSHLVFPGIKAWALGCEPPIGLNASEKTTYLDEADRFYADPITFLNHELGKPPQARKSGFFGTGRQASTQAGIDQFCHQSEEAWDGRLGRKMWPEYVAFFAQLEPTIKRVLRGADYRECWRGWNSFGHDDWRRKGDIMVWCRKEMEKKPKKAPALGRLERGWW